ncbi:MAG: galactokinase, partial [Chloroflexota bacterium]
MRIERVQRLRIHRWLFVQVHTDGGLTGLGEAGLWAYPDACDAVLAAWEPYLVGQDPLRIEHHWQALYRHTHFRGGAVAGALGAVDAALWDIAGQHLEVPVYQLLGGKVRDRVRVQTQIHAAAIDDLAARAQAEVARGITAIRITPFAPDFAARRYDDLLADAVA